MGEVHKARDTRLDRTVAIKVLPEYIAKREDLRARFEREARAVASLNHPHICVLYDIGNQDGVGGYMVMEFMEGETLAARIEKGGLPLDQVLKFAVQIADALDRAHRAGVTHRDVKPQNIMLTRDGAKVLVPTDRGRTAHPTLLVLGRVVPHKRVELVLEAAAVLRQEIPDLQVHVVGEGYWLPAVQETLDRLKLDDTVVLHGRVDEQTKADLLARSWINVVPSIKEGWGLSVVEAGTHGTPSVAFRAAGGLAESILDGSTGLLLDDLDDLVPALRGLLTDRARCAALGEQARAYASGFSWQTSAAEFSAVLDR